MSAEPTASLSLDGWSEVARGWWRDGVIHQICVTSFRLPPGTAGWFLLEVDR
jgi:hypothetical protein